MYKKLLSFQKVNLFLAVAYSLPVFLLLWFVTAFSVNLPFWDDWSLINFFSKINNGTANFGDFFEQHNEHRIFFPRIIFAILAFSSNWNIKLEIYFNTLLAFINFILLYNISASNAFRKKDIVLFNLFNLTTCIVNFSLMQYENWLWGFQITWFLINTCLILGVFFLTGSNKILTNVRIMLASVCCFVASFSSAHGLISWLALLPSLYFIQDRNKYKKIKILLWIVMFALCVSIYFIGYKKPDNHPSISFVFQHPLMTSEYFLTLIGFSLGKNILAPILTGLILLSTFLFFNVFCLKNYRSEFASKAAPWLSLGWFTILFASMTTVGRAGFGVEQAISSRYITVSTLLVISSLQLCRLWISYKWSYNRTKKYILSGIFLGFLLYILVLGSMNSIIEGQNAFAHRKAGKTCLEIINFIDPSIDNSPSNCLSFIFPKQSVIREKSKTIEKLEFRDFPKDISFTTEAEKIHGFIDAPPTTEQALNISRSDTLKLYGWGILPDSQEQPPIVLLSYDNNQTFFATGLVNTVRYDVSRALGSSLYDKSGWEANVSLKSIPTDETIIKAWVYDRKNQHFIKLNGEPKIKLME